MFRFAIRDVLWLTVVTALALGWWVDHRLTTKYRVGPPQWHGILRAIVQELQRQEIDLDRDQVVGIGILADSGAWRWSTIDWTPPQSAPRPATSAAGLAIGASDPFSLTPDLDE